MISPHFLVIRRDQQDSADLSWASEVLLAELSPSDDASIAGLLGGVEGQSGSFAATEPGQESSQLLPTLLCLVIPFTRLLCSASIAVASRLQLGQPSKP